MAYSIRSAEHEKEGVKGVNMKLFLTSNPFLPDGRINDENEFLWNIKYSLPYETNALYISSSYKDALTNDREASRIKDAFNSQGIFFRTMDVLDYRTASMKDDEIKAHNFIIIADGHVPTQSDFMRITGLKRKLQGYDGTIMAIGTGAMNAAEEAYILPQLEGEAMNNEFMRFTEGLGLTKTQVIPHYDVNIVKKVDGLSLRDRILFDSKNRKFLGLPDGSYLMNTDGVELIYGRYYKIADRQTTMEDAGFLAKAFA